MCGSDEKCVQYLGRKSGRKRPFGRRKITGENSIEVDLEEKGSDGMSCIHLPKDRN
jgi:hypothetical protein